MAALRELAGGRADLLAEVAGVLEGAREGEPDEQLARQAVPGGRGGSGGDPGVDRGGTPPEGLGRPAGVLGRLAWRGSTAALRQSRTRAGHEAASGSYLPYTIDPNLASPQAGARPTAAAQGREP